MNGVTHQGPVIQVFLAYVWSSLIKFSTFFVLFSPC